jgi:hypothetical protein
MWGDVSMTRLKPIVDAADAAIAVVINLIC